MPIVTDPTEANAILRRKLQADVPPELLESDIQGLLNDNIAATEWTAATAYTAGMVVVPSLSARVGSRFVCVIGGTSGSTEPTWPTWLRGQVGDGNVLWEEAGLECDLWDMGAAIQDGWDLKVAKAVVYIGTELSDIYTHCVEQRDASRTVRMG